MSALDQSGTQPSLGQVYSRRIFAGAASVFFLFMLVLPTTYQLERGLVLGALVFVAALYSFQGGWRMHRTILAWGMITVTASLLFILNGLVGNTPGAVRVSTVLVAWPIVYLLFGGLVRNPRTIVQFEKVIVLGVIACGLMGILLVAAALHGYTQAMTSVLNFQGGAVGIYEGFIEYKLFNMTTLIYGLPFLTASLAINRRGFALSWQWRSLAWVALILSIVACIVSGRRVFWLLAILTPAIVIVFFLFGGMRQSARRLVPLVVVVPLIGAAMLTIVNISVVALAEQLFNAFDLSIGYSADPRLQQFTALISEWSDRPILGHGAGASSDTILRSEEAPWAYELSYVALLFQTGLIGVTIYGSAVGWIFYAGLAIVRERRESAPVLLPLLAGLAGFLFINATNPYLMKFDYLWTLFLPIAAINAYRGQRLKSISSLSTGIPVSILPTALKP